MNTFALAAAGGVLIGLAAVLLMAALGRIAGISGIAAGLVDGRSRDWGWRFAFVAGLIAAPVLLGWIGGDSGIGSPQVGPPWMVLAGLLVGVGTRVGGGCTSGHGVCGIARLSPRSLIATMVFMLFGIATVFALHHLPGKG
ncbi:MAG: YeeE/YedE thiosulfate transporter family protein [Dokdonella sp.]